MFGTIRRHQNWLWFVIIGLMIVSLLYWTDQRGDGSGRGKVADAPKINGKTVTPQTLDDYAREVRLLYFLNFRKWPEQNPEHAQQINFDLENEAWLRLFRVSKAEELGIQVSDQLLRDLTTRLLGDYPVDKFAKDVLEKANPPLTLDDFERFVTHDAAIQQLGTVVGAAGRMVTPGEAEETYRRDHQELAGEIVFLSISNYLSKVVITNGALSNFFSLSSARYRVPDMVKVSYVEFSKSNYFADADKQFASVTNLDYQIRDLYYRAGTNSFKDTNGNVLPEAEALTKIKEDQRDRLAISFAARRANEFANKLYDQKGLTLATFEKLATDEKLPLGVTPAFDIENGPTNMVVSEKFAQEAFQLDLATKPVSFQPIGGSNGVYLIALKEKIPGRPQTFQEVASKVTEDYKRMNAYTLANNEATNFIGRVTNAISQGKTFREVAQQLKLNAEALPPISLSTESVTNLEERVNIRQLRQVLFSTEPGKVSPYIRTPDGGYVVYVKEKLPIDDKKMREDLPKFEAEMRYHKQNEIFNQWFRKQVEKANLPLNKPKQPQGQRAG
jgi:hypothetical protein